MQITNYCKAQKDLKSRNGPVTCLKAECHNSTTHPLFTTDLATAQTSMQMTDQCSVIKILLLASDMLHVQTPTFTFQSRHVDLSKLCTECFSQTYRLLLLSHSVQRYSVTPCRKKNTFSSEDTNSELSSFTLSRYKEGEKRR